MTIEELYIYRGYYAADSRRRSSRRQITAIASSMVFHLALLGGIQAVVLMRNGMPEAKLARGSIIPLVDPSRFQQKTRTDKTPAPPPTPSTPSQDGQNVVSHETLPFDTSKVDPDRAEIDIQYSTKHLADTLAAFHGYLAFGDAKTPEYISARFGPPNWTIVHEGPERRDFYIALEIEERYPFLEELRRQHQLKGQTAYVLFEFSFLGRLRDAVREKAVSERRSGPVVTASILLAINPVRIEVQSMEMGSVSNH